MTSLMGRGRSRSAAEVEAGVEVDVDGVVGLGASWANRPVSENVAAKSKARGNFVGIGRAGNVTMTPGC